MVMWQDPPGPSPAPAPKPMAPDATDYHSQTSETGKALPILYGTARISGEVVERYVGSFYVNGNAPAWNTNVGFTFGNFVYNQGNLYLCVQTGTSAASGDGPTGQGHGIVDNTCLWDYATMGWRHALCYAFCEGPVYGTLRAWRDKASYVSVNSGGYGGIPHDSAWLNFFLGRSLGDRPGGHSVGTTDYFPHPPAGSTYDDFYANTATMFLFLTTSSDSALPDVSVEIQGIFSDATHLDVNPADIVLDLLTHNRRGISWPSARIDAISTGVGATSWRTYCTAFGLTLSWLIDAQTSVITLLEMLLTATNTDAVWTNRPDGLGGMLKFIPLGDEALTANGVTYTPNATPVYNLTNDDYIDPLQIIRKSPADAFNACPIEFTLRADDYRRLIVDDPEMADVDLRGLRKAPVLAFPQVMNQAAVTMLSRIRANRSLQVRNQYRFRLPWRYLLLEPTDLVTLTDTVSGISQVPVRIIAMEEDPSGAGFFTFTAEDWPAKVATAAQYTTQAGDGFKPNQEAPLGIFQTIPATISINTVPDGSSTRGGAVDNLWPNPTSEMSPPDGMITTTAEWANRFKLGSGSYAGNWVRQLNGQNLVLSYLVPAAPGDTYYLEAQIEAVVAGANKGGFVKIESLDKTGAVLAVVTSPNNDTNTWVRQFVQMSQCLSGTTQVRLSICSGSDAAANVYFDSIYARRAIIAGVIDTSQVATRHMTPGQFNTLNLWPNPTSESDPPGSYLPPGDGTDAEFDFRYNAGAGAYAGNWVRKLARATTGTTKLTLLVPALDSDYYQIRTRYKFISSGGGATGSVIVRYLRADLSEVANNTTSLSTGQVTWSTPIAAGGLVTAGPNVVWILFELNLTTASVGAAEVWFDSIAAKSLISGFDLASSAYEGGQSTTGPTTTNNANDTYTLVGWHIQNASQMVFVGDPANMTYVNFGQYGLVVSGADTKVIFNVGAIPVVGETVIVAFIPAP